MIGRGECVPYARYGESPDTVLAAIDRVAGQLTDRVQLQTLLPPGAARNALDCALWDLWAKQTAQPVWALAGLTEPQPVATAYTISLDVPQNMAIAAQAAHDRPLLKLKLGTPDDGPRLRAVRAAVPSATLIVDANEGWQSHDFERLIPHLVEAKIALIEQPLAADADDALRSISCPIPLCADESTQGTAIAALADRYQFVNIKLDKTGGLTGALTSLREAQANNMGIMLGCMVSTSLAMAPAALLASQAHYVDLDGPLLLDTDRSPGLTYRHNVLIPYNPVVWG